MSTALAYHSAYADNKTGENNTTSNMMESGICNGVVPSDSSTPQVPTLSPEQFQKSKELALSDGRVQQWINAASGNYTFMEAYSYGYTAQNNNDSKNVPQTYTFSCPTFFIRAFGEGIGSGFQTENNRNVINVNAVDIQVTVDADHNRVTKVLAVPVIPMNSHGIMVSSNDPFRYPFSILWIVGGIAGGAAAFAFLKIRKT